MAFPRPSSRIALLILLLAVIVLSLFGSLVPADRTLASTDRRAVVLDAREAATHAERELLRRGNALNAVDPTAARAGFPGGDFVGVWLLDSAGRVLWRSREGAREDTVALMRMAMDIRGGAWPSV